MRPVLETWLRTWLAGLEMCRDVEDRCVPGTEARTDLVFVGGQATPTAVCPSKGAVCAQR